MDQCVMAHWAGGACSEIGWPVVVRDLQPIRVQIERFMLAGIAPYDTDLKPFSVDLIHAFLTMIHP